MTDNPNSDEEPVGYGQPPRHSRFQPGQSGNPKGRPKGSKNVGSILRRLLDVEFPVSQRGVETTKSTREILIQRLIEKAARGDRKATEFILKLDMELDAIDALREASDKSRELSPSLKDVFKAFLERETAEAKRSEHRSGEAESDVSGGSDEEGEAP
ncbi:MULTISPECIES: DUF5681 domain-containing protein [Hyphobacterium]|jgi:hypothetical protein|uniref:DUF5681 domain-containing protein n=1 Tax=Hyphobacterium vulgare TaxID=1736751 RepID=A0ABV6ZW33_9PROT